MANNSNAASITPRRNKTAVPFILLLWLLPLHESSCRAKYNCPSGPVSLDSAPTAQCVELVFAKRVNKELFIYAFTQEAFP
jgi:hypothetical protein